MEKLRLAMKMYAFARTNIKRVLAEEENRSSSLKSKGSDESSDDQRAGEGEGSQTNENLRKRKKVQNNHNAETQADEKQVAKRNDLEFKSMDDNVLCPSFSKLVYFLYAPTLIYRDHYPRNDTRRWDFIIYHVLHMFGCIIFYSLVQHRFGYVLLQNFGPHNPMAFKEIVAIGWFQIIVGIAALFLGWVTMLHSVQNVFAELLRFGDRSFYKAWWSSASMAEYHRTWNTPVQDFLYNYVYKEAWEKGLGKKAKWLPTLLVFIISNIFHEYATTFVFQFFCPVMGLMFMGPGTFLTFMPNKKFPQLGNIFMLWSITLGYAFFHIFYVAEYFARVNNCPAASTPLLDFFIPRFLSCGAVKWR
jgi:sterol O-acyltransferase